MKMLVNRSPWPCGMVVDCETGNLGSNQVGFLDLGRLLPSVSLLMTYGKVVASQPMVIHIGQN